MLVVGGWGSCLGGERILLLMDGEVGSLRSAFVGGVFFVGFVCVVGDMGGDGGEVFGTISQEGDGGVLGYLLFMATWTGWNAWV